MDSGSAAPLLPAIAPAPQSFGRFNDTDISHKVQETPELAQYTETFNNLIGYLNTPKFNIHNIALIKEQIQKLMGLKSNQELSTELFEIVTDQMSASKITQDELQNITENLFLLNFQEEIQEDLTTHDATKILLVLFLQYKIYYSSKYSDPHNNLVGFKQHYQLTLSENIFRHAIGLNAGLGSGSTIYGIATGILLTVPVMAVSGLASIIVCSVIMNYFLSAYSDEDKDLTYELTNQENRIRLFANTEAEERLKCYKKLLKLRKLYRQGIKDENFDVDKLKLSPVMQDFFLSDYPLNTCVLDEVIDNTLENLPKEKSTTEEVKKITLTPKNSIYLRLFHSKYWGPVLSFFGAVGTLFGVTRTILTVAGVVALAGSAPLLPLVIASSAIFCSALFALKHWQFNCKSESRKKGFDTFRSNHIDALQIRAEKLKHTIEKFKTISREIEHGISASLLKTENPAVAALSKRRISIANSSIPSLQVDGAEHLAKFSLLANAPLITDKQITDPDDSLKAETHLLLNNAM